MKKNIGIFFGGRSVEHEISIISALQVINHIDKNKYNVTPVYISQEGIWYTDKYFWLTKLENFRDQKLQLKKCTRVIPSMNANDGRLLSYPKGLFKRSKTVTKLDVVLPVFHGAYGEDGCFQGVFEVMNIPYAGSDVTSSAICMNKTLTKEFCEAMQIPVIKYVRINAETWVKDQAACLIRIKEHLDFPVIVKPNDLGSSIAVNKAANDDELVNAIDLVTYYSSDILIEHCVTNLKEVNCSVAETPAGIEVSECEEPVVTNKDQFLSYDEKYLPKDKTTSQGMAGATRKIPAGISDAVKKEIHVYAVKIFQHAGCSGVTRIDFIIDMDDNRVYLNEINTIPGSLAFYLWEANGKNFETLITELIENAIKKYAKKGKLRKNFKSNVLININAGKLGNKLGNKLGGRFD